MSAVSELRNALAVLWISIGLIGFGLFLVAYFRLFRQALRMPNRKEALWKVVNVQPRKDPNWPNTSPEAEMIVKGAMTSLLFIAFFVVIVAVR